MITTWLQSSRKWLARNLWPVLLVLAVLLGSLAIPQVVVRVSSQYLVYVLVLVPAVAVALLLLRQPALGLILSFLGGIFVPFTGPSGISVLVLGLFLMMGIWILDFLVHDRDLRLAPSRINAPILLFVGAAILTFIMGRFSWYILASSAPMDAQVGGFFIYILSAGALLMAGNLFNSEQWLKRMTWIFLALSGIFMFARLLSINFISGRFHIGFTAQSMFWTWLVAMAVGQILFNKELKNHARGLLVGIVLITLYVAYFQAGSWKSGYLPPLGVIGFLLILRYPKMIPYLIPVAAIAGWILLSQALSTEQYSYETRVEAWLIVLDLVKVNPVFGLGFGNYYFYTPLIPIRGWYVNFNSHSQYVDLIAQGGLIGLLIFLWIFWAVARSGWELRNQVGNGFSRGYVFGVLGGIVGSLFAGFFVDWILPFVYNIGFNGFRASIIPWIFMGGLISLEQIKHQFIES